VPWISNGRRVNTVSQSVLSIDATQVPARAIIAAVDRSSVKILSTESIELDLSDLDELGGIEHQGEDGEVIEPVKKERRYLSLSSFIEKVDARITHAILILNPKDYLSLNLSLPFKDYKTLSRVVDLEVQDQVPFDVSEFLIQPRIVGETGPESDVHVSATPREFLRQVISVCRREGFEPTIISTASSALAGLFLLEPERILSNSAVVLAKREFTCLAISIEGQVKTDRLIEEQDPKAIFTEIRRTLLSAERRYGQKIERLYLIGDRLSPSVLAKETAREVTPVEEMKDGCGLAAMGAVFAQDEVAATILTNFRIREFSYNPYIKEILRGAKALLPWFLGALLLCILSMAGVYYSRQRELLKLTNALTEQVKRAAPELPVNEGQEVRAVQEENRRIDRQLKELGSSSKIGALEVIAELSKDIASAGELSVRRISITGGGVSVQGTAPDYAAVEKLERIMKTKKPALYCKIRKTTGASAAGQPDRRSFTFDLRICE